MIIAMIGQKGLPARSGGIERHVELLASGLASQGHKVIVFGRAWYVVDRELRLPGVEQVLTLGIRSKHLDAITHSFTALLAARKARPDVVHIHGTGIALLTPLARLLHPKAKVIVTFHCIDRTLSKWGLIAKWAFRLGEFLACRAAHRTVAVSQTLTRYCMEVYGVQTSYIPHPFQMPEAFEVGAESLKEYKLTPNGYFLFVGRLIPDKQAHVLVKAFIRAKAERPDLMLGKKLAIVGGASWTDQYASWLCSLASTHKDVILFGEKVGAELAALQAGALACVFPTSSEGLSVAIMEAAAYKRLIIATDIAPNIEVTGGHLLKVEVGDEASLSNALIASLEMSSRERELMAAKTQVHVEATYDYSRRVRDMADMYLEVCGEPESQLKLATHAV